MALPNVLIIGRNPLSGKFFFFITKMKIDISIICYFTGTIFHV